MIPLRLLMVGLVLTTFLMVPTTTAATGCGHDGGTAAGDFYVSGTSVWAESNGVPGLQKTARFCHDGTYVPADSHVASPRCVGGTCIV